MKKLIYIVILLCILPLNLKSQSSKISSYLKSVEHGVYIDDNFIYPYSQVGFTLAHRLYFETGMLDLPSSINIDFNTTVQNKAGRFSYLLNNMKEPVEYNGPERDIERYHFVGLCFDWGRYRVIPQVGSDTHSNPAIKLSQYYRLLDVEGAFVDLGLHTQFSDSRNFVFIGYSACLNLY